MLTGHAPIALQILRQAEAQAAAIAAATTMTDRLVDGTFGLGREIVGNVVGCAPPSPILLWSHRDCNLGHTESTRILQ